MLAEKFAVRSEKENGAVAGAQLTLDHADDNVAGMSRRSFAEPLGLRAGDLDRCLEIQSKLFPPCRGAGADDESIAETFGVSGDEGLRKDDHFRARGRGLPDQTDC